MDEVVGDELAAVDSSYLQGKGDECFLKAGSGSMLESHEVIIPSEGQYHGGSSPEFATILEGKNPDRGGASQHPWVSPRCMDDTGVMVEELTLKNYNGENLAIVGTSHNRDRMQTRPNQWQHFYKIAGGFGSGSLGEDAVYKDYGLATSNAWEDAEYTVFPELLGQKLPDDDHNDNKEHQPNNENKAVESNTLTTLGAIRTKILSNSGFSQYFVKNTLKGKGVICKGPAREELGAELKGQTNLKAAGTAMVAFDAPLGSNTKTILPPSHSVSGRGLDLYLNSFRDGVNLREWLKAGHNKANKVRSFYLFKQIVKLVDLSHSQGVALQYLRPSRFKLLPSNQVIYLGSSVHQEIADSLTCDNTLIIENDRNQKRALEPTTHPAVNQMVKKQKFGENVNVIRQWCQFQSRESMRGEYKRESNSSSPHVYNTSDLPSTDASDPLEEKWYASPEELDRRGCTFSSNIYALGVFFFELLLSVGSEKERAVAMSDMRHRILPPDFLSENPKEAGFCFWLLHPEPSSRPTARKVLQSDVITGIEESFGDELSSSISQVDAESELLSHFLLSLREQKQKETFKLVEEIKSLEADIEEVERRQPNKRLVLSCSSESLHARGNRFLYREPSSFEVHSNSAPGANDGSTLMKNIHQLESAYFSMRSNIQLFDNDVATRASKDLLKQRDNPFLAQKDEELNKPIDHLGAFFSGLCKYARYTKFEVRGILRNGDFHNSANVICSMSFDRDQEYLAAAGVSKKIKIFEFQALFNEAVDIHYPVVEMSNKSKFSCICWNTYIRNYLASTDYDGIIKLWDAGTGQEFSQFSEHIKRAWSVDFSQVDPTKLASGGDDYSVKLWNINERNSLCTIRNIANVCCVQMSAHSSHLLAFGSADYKTYCYDLRNVSSPWCILSGHDKAVSYVKFLDSETIVSASTDNTLKLWDLNKTSSTGLSTTACVSTLKGHTNEKNFVGLSVADGYIACGSETNEVYAYYKSLPMPITSHKFGSIDPISGKETEDDNGQFVSSVCWRQKSDMLVAANSSGCIKVLEMV